MATGCTRGRLRTQQPPEATACVRPGQPPHTRTSFCATCVRNLVALHPSASQNRLLGAPGAVFAHKNQLLLRKTTGSERVRPSAYPSRPCRPGPFRSRVADDYARLESVAIPLPCAPALSSAPNTLLLMPLGCARGRFRPRKDQSRRTKEYFFSKKEK